MLKTALKITETGSIALAQAALQVSIAFGYGLQLEQMELEVRDLSADIRPKYSNRLKSYEKELQRLEKDYVSKQCQPEVLPQNIVQLVVLLYIHE